MLKFIFNVMLASSMNMAVAAGAVSVDKPLGPQTVRLPVLSEFSAACEEDDSIAERLAFLAPQRAIFLTCFLPIAKLRLVRGGQPSDLYPYITVSVDPVHPSGPFTSREFQQLRDATRARFGNLRARDAEARRALEAQDANIAARGGNLKRENYRQELFGFFNLPSNVESFSFLVGRSVKASEAGASEELCEMIATTTILHSGRLLRASVIDDCGGAMQGLRAREMALTWLTAFSALNAKRK